MKSSHRLTLPRSRPPARRGMSLYLTVMSTALTVSLFGLSGLTIVRIERKQTATSTEILDARANAASAVELALRVIANDPNWRTTYTSGVETTPKPLGGSGTVSWMLVDSDGNLTDADIDLRLKGIGRAGVNVVQVSSVQVQEIFLSPDYLRTVAHAGGTLSIIENATAIGGPFSSNTTFDVSSAKMAFGNAEAPSASGNVPEYLTGTFTDPKTPAPSTVFNEVYKPRATEILYSNLITHNDHKHMEGTLNATTNPWGATNSAGIYYVHIPASAWLHLRNFSWTGTLLIEIEAGGKLITTNLDGFQPARVDHPALMLKINGTEVTLHFKGQLGVQTQGLVHVIGANSTIVLGDRFNHLGTVVSEGAIQLGHKKNTTITHDVNLQNNPPQGYAVSDGLAPVAATWRWDAAP